MRRTWLCIFGVLLLVGGNGCRPSTADIAAALKEQIAGMNDMASILEGIKDEASAEAEMPRLEKAAERVQQASKRMADLKPSPDQAQRLFTQYSGEQGTAALRLVNGAMAAETAAPQHSQRIKEILAKVNVKQT
jgi:hypothetical protein